MTEWTCPDCGAVLFSATGDWAHACPAKTVAMSYGVRMGRQCAVHRHDEHVPMERHHIWPLGHGGPDKADNIVVVCSNGHGTIHAYLDLLLKHSGKVPWEQGQFFGPHVRGYAQRGYDAIRAASKPR